MHLPLRCKDCLRQSECEAERAFSCAEKRYVVEAVMTAKVTEHRVMRAQCPMSDRSAWGPDKGSFPKEVSAYIQYGDSFVTLVSLLSNYGAVSANRICGLVCGLFGVTLSAGTVISMISRFAGKTKPFLAEIREEAIESKVTNHDETGLRVGKELMWMLRRVWQFFLRKWKRAPTIVRNLLANYTEKARTVPELRRFRRSAGTHAGRQRASADGGQCPNSARCTSP